MVVNAQEEEKGTVSYCMPVEVELELWCDGIYIDFMHDVYAEVHLRVHYEDGNVIWTKATVHGTFLFKGVTYQINGKTNLITEDIQEAHYNLKGNDGSHYVGILTADDHLHTFTFSKALCPGN
jgi:hypothetical protein